VKKIEFFRHSIDKNDRKRTDAVLKSIFLTTGKEVETFEQKFSAYTGLNHTIGLTSCTAALHLGLIALGIGQGHEVITTPLSFCATANAIIHAGATPVFVDVEEETGNLNADLIGSAITEKTKAVLPVHLYGQMCDMNGIRSSAAANHLCVVEDAAHAIEAERDGIKVGNASDIACFSFYATKNITSGEGGAAATNRKELDDSLRMLRLHGVDRSAADRYTHHYQHWDMPVLGWKYNMDNIHASLLVGQIDRIDDLWQQRDAIWKLYEQELSSVRNISILRTLGNVRHARHLFTILVPPQKRDGILWNLQDHNIGVAVNYRPIHLLKYYRDRFAYKEGDYPAAEDIGKRTISLPLYPALREQDVVYIVKTLKKIL